MKRPPASIVTEFTPIPVERRKRLRRLVVLILLVSVGIHVVAGVGAGIWVIARYFTQQKTQFVVQKEITMPAQDRRHQLAMEEMASLRPKPVYNNRIQSLRPSRLALPELPVVPLETITPIDTEALISDQVDGIGRYGEGSGSGGGFFGGKGAAGSGLLAGSFYDLKQDKDGKPTKMAVTPKRGYKDPVANAAYEDVIGRLSRTNSSESVLRDFYRAPDTLFLSKIAIPLGDAREAPKAFEVGDKVKPSYWVAVYDGRMTAPESGNYRFLGFGDDYLLVKINGRLVFDGSLLGGTRLYKKPGLSFSVEKGMSYDIEVIIGESPGGYFNAWLQIEKIGGDGPYWFRMSDENVTLPKRKLPNDGLKREPDTQKNGPVWRPASRGIKPVGVGFQR